MLLEEESHERGEQSLLERRSPPSDSASRSGQEKSDQPSADAREDLIRARGPEPQQRPAGESRVVEFPEHREDQHPEQDRESADKPRGSVLRRHPFAFVIGLLLSVAAVAAGALYLGYARHFESTDDAFIAARQFAVASEVSGYITAVPVTDNQHVAAGDVIARIDERDYRAALDQATAQFAHDQAVLAQAQRNLVRYQTLAKTSDIAQQQVDDQTYLVEQDAATVAYDQAKVDTAQLNISYATVTAAQAGRVVNLSAGVGQYAQAGTTLTNFVPDEMWVTANFKETQLDAMRPGRPVTLEIDAYPERSIRGHVASVQPGSGPAFSLLPPENATGNYVKIVQRVPVKIIIDDLPSDIVVGPGMSVDPTVRITPTASLYERLRGWL